MASLLFILAVIVGIVLLFKWPFHEQDLTESIQEVVPGTVRIAKFRSTVLPYPGCVAEGVSVQASSGDPASHTSVDVQSIVVRARYSDLILRPGYTQSRSPVVIRIHASSCLTREIVK